MTLRNALGEELHFTHYSWRRALLLAADLVRPW